MQRRTGFAVRPAIAALAFAVSAIALAPVSDAAPAETCLRAPKGVAPQGSHWYYRIDRETQRRCWYLAEIGRGRVAQRSEARSAPPQAEPYDDDAAPAPPTRAPAASAAPLVNVPSEPVVDAPTPKITTLVTRNVSDADQIAQAPTAASTHPPAPSAAPDTLTSEAPPRLPEQAAVNQQAAAAISEPQAAQPTAAAEEKSSAAHPTTPILLLEIGRAS